MPGITLNILHTCLHLILTAIVRNPSHSTLYSTDEQTGSEWVQSHSLALVFSTQLLPPPPLTLYHFLNSSLGSCSCQAIPMLMTTQALRQGCFLLSPPPRSSIRELTLPRSHLSTSLSFSNAHVNLVLRQALRGPWRFGIELTPTHAISQYRPLFVEVSSPYKGPALVFPSLPPPVQFVRNYHG